MPRRRIEYGGWFEVTRAMACARRIEIGNSDPACFAGLLQIGHRLPRFLELRPVVSRRPVHLVEIDGLRPQAPQAVFAFLPDGFRRMIRRDFSARVPAQHALGENVRAGAAPAL